MLKRAMNENLESMINGHDNKNFKSDGERRIAYLLDTNSIKYRYESGVLINPPKSQPRIWYPDFYLPEFKTYIEYYGMAGHKQYDRGIKTKESTYTKTGIDVISVYPWMFSKDWQGYIMRELNRGILQKYRHLRRKPYWSKRGNSSTWNSQTPHHEYRQGFRKRY